MPHLRTLREAARASLAEAAACLDIAPSTVSRWERGERTPSDSQSLRRLAAFYLSESERRATVARQLAKGLLTLTLVFLLTPAAQAQGSRHDGIVLGARGPVAGASVAVCSEPANVSTQPCSPLATLYPNTLLTLPAIASSGGAVRSANVVTITTTSAHGLSVGQSVTISGVTDSSFNGAFTVTSTPSGTAFAYSQAGPNATSGSGTVSAPNPLQADALGNFHFYAAPGLYTVQIYSPQIQTPSIQNDVLLACDPTVACGIAGSIPSATSSAIGGVQLAGDLSGTAASPQVVSVHLAAPLPAVQVGTGYPFSNLSGNASPSQIGTGTPGAGKYVDGGTGTWTTLPVASEALIEHAPIGTAGQTLTSAVAPCSTSVASCTVVTFAQGHTLIRFQYFLQTSPAGCSTAPGIGLRDITAGSNIFSTTIANGASLGTVDSGALNLAMTAGHTYGVGPTQTSAGCSTNANVIGVVAVYK